MIPSDDVRAAEQNRVDFLIKMYEQKHADFNRHIQINQQAMAALVGAFAVLALVEKGILPLDVAVALIVLIGAWVIAHLYQASFGFNRNLVIIANIERLLLKESDLRDVHHYFAKHRQAKSMLGHLRIQYFLALMLGLLVLVYHFVKQVMPGLREPLIHFDVVRSLPYLVLLSCVVYLVRLRAELRATYERFLQESPGIRLQPRQPPAGQAPAARSGETTSDV